MSDAQKNRKISKRNKEILKEVGLFAAKTTVISGAILAGVAITVPAIGFTAGGVAAGSLAAAFQSAYLGGTIASGSLFALLQSAGAAGLAASTQADIVAASATAAGAHSIVKNVKKNKKSKSNCPNNQDEQNGNDNDEEDEENDQVNDAEKLKSVTIKSNFSICTSENISLTKGDKETWKKIVNIFLNKGKYKADEILTYFDEDDIESLNPKWKDVVLTAFYCNYTDEVIIMQHLVKKV